MVVIDMLIHEAESLAYFWQGLEDSFTMDVVIGPLAVSIGIPVLRAGSMDGLEVVLLEACNPASNHGLIH